MSENYRRKTELEFVKVIDGKDVGAAAERSFNERRNRGEPVFLVTGMSESCRCMAAHLPEVSEFLQLAIVVEQEARRHTRIKVCDAHLLRSGADVALMPRESHAAVTCDTFGTSVAVCRFVATGCAS